MSWDKNVVDLMDEIDTTISNSEKKPQKKWLLLFFLFLLLLWVALATFFYIKQNSNKWVIEEYVSAESDIYFRIRFEDWNKDMFQKFTQNMTDSNMKDCSELMEHAEEIAISTMSEDKLSIVYVKIEEGQTALQKCIESPSLKEENYEFLELEKNLYAVGDKNSMDFISSIEKNILEKEEMKSYIEKYDIINYTSFKNQQSRFAAITSYVKLADLDFFIFGVKGNQDEIAMDVNIHQNGIWNISDKYKFTPEFINQFQKETTYFLLELWPIFHLFDINFENFEQGLDMLMSEANPNSGIILSIDDKKALYSIFEKNISVSVHEANNIFGIGLQLSFGDDSTWKTLQKISPFIKQYLSLLNDSDWNSINIKETKNKLLFSYDKYNLELTNENNKVIGRVLDPIADIAQDKSIYNSQTLASIYYNEKKMVEVLQKFTKMYGKDLDIPSMSTMINGLENKEEVYGNLYIDGSVIRLEFIIK